MNNRIVDQESKIPFIGKVKIGEKTRNDKGIEHCKSLDYFVATGNFAKVFQEKYGSQPRVIRILFANENSISTFWILRGKELYGLSDGLTVKYADQKAKVFREQTFQTKDECKAFMQKIEDEIGKKDIFWKKKLSMDFILPDIDKLFGFWRFETGGKESMIDQISTMFDGASKLYENISLVPFWLSVSMKETRTFGETHKYPVVSITPAIGLSTHFQIQGSAANPLETALEYSTPKKAIAPTIKKLPLTNEIWEQFKENAKKSPKEAIEAILKYQLTEDHMLYIESLKP